MRFVLIREKSGQKKQGKTHIGNVADDVQIGNKTKKNTGTGEG